MTEQDFNLTPEEYQAEYESELEDGQDQEDFDLIEIMYRAESLTDYELVGAHPGCMAFVAASIGYLAQRLRSGDAPENFWEILRDGDPSYILREELAIAADAESEALVTHANYSTTVQ